MEPRKLITSAKWPDRTRALEEARRCRPVAVVCPAAPWM